MSEPILLVDAVRAALDNGLGEGQLRFTSDHVAGFAGADKFAVYSVLASMAKRGALNVYRPVSLVRERDRVSFDFFTEEECL